MTQALQIEASARREAKRIIREAGLPVSPEASNSDLIVRLLQIINSKDHEPTHLRLRDAVEMVLDADGELSAIDFDMLRAALDTPRGAADNNADPAKCIGYASVSWSVGDVQTLRPGLTDEQALTALQDAERHLRDRLIEVGWDVLDNLLEEVGREEPTGNEATIAGGVR